jgi:quercetin dioxygenase-like cupin family protein
MSLAIEVRRAVKLEILHNCGEKLRHERESRARERLAELQAALEDIAATEGEANCPLKHTFTPGMYTREIFVPAGTIIVTKIHRHEHSVFVLQGDCTVYSNDGTLKRVTAPCMMVTPAGTKRAVYVHTDTIWVTVHANPNNETDLQKLENMLIAKDYDALPSATEKIEGETPCLG